MRLTRIARDKVCQLPAQGMWFSLGTLAASISKTDLRDITEILLKVALNPNQTKKNKFGEFKHKIYYKISLEVREYKTLCKCKNERY